MAQPLSYDDWYQQNIYSESGATPYMYQKYKSKFTPEILGNSATQTPGGPQSGPGYAPPDPFKTLDQANNFGYNQALGLYSQGPTQLGFGDNSLQSQDMIQGLVNNPQYSQPMGGQMPDPNFGMFQNPSVQQPPTMADSMSGIGETAAGMGFGQQQTAVRPELQTGQPSSGQMNPWTSGALQTTQQQLTNTNPFMQGFQNFGNMQNQAFEGTVNRAMDNVTDRVNSQFGLGGRTNSGAHGGYMVDSLGDVANQMYSDNFAGNMNRNMKSMQMGADAFTADQSRNMNAALNLPGLANTRFDDARVLSGLGQDQDRMRQILADSGWGSLQKYMDIVGGSRETPKEPKSSAVDKALGVAATVAPFLLRPDAPQQQTQKFYNDDTRR